MSKPEHDRKIDYILEQICATVKTQGARIVREIFSFPGGRRFHFLDPNGNELAVWGD